MIDLLINRARIYDGSGNKPYLGSVGVHKGHIVFVSGDPAAALEAAEALDADGMVLCPGFVDTHTHSDMMLLHDGHAGYSLLQGVTTEILGQDGLSYAPMSADHLKAYAPYIKGLNGLPDDVSLDFSTVGQYLDKYQNRIGINVAWLVPHCALRLMTAGFENRLLTDDEIRSAGTIARDAILEGACGFSTGLSYYPGSFSDTREIIGICSAVREAGGIYVTHLRSVFRGERFNAVHEALEIARQSGIRLHYSHFRTGGPTIGHADQLLEPVDEAVRDGMDITLEMYPYPYGASYAPMFVPMWANDGGMKKILERLNDPAIRKSIADEIDRDFPAFDGVITYAANTPELEGSVFSELAKREGTTKGRIIAELLKSEELALSFHDVDPELSSDMEQLFEKDILSMLSRPYYMVGSDGIRIGSRPHPRGCGSFARLWRIAREHQFPFETLVERLSALPCRRFGLEKRGMIREGWHADLVMLDPDRFRDSATDEKPFAAPEGMLHCWVNGVQAVRDGRMTDSLSGQVLRFKQQ